MRSKQWLEKSKRAQKEKTWTNEQKSNQEKQQILLCWSFAVGLSQSTNTIWFRWRYWIDWPSLLNEKNVLTTRFSSHCHTHTAQLTLFLISFVFCLEQHVCCVRCAIERETVSHGNGVSENGCCYAFQLNSDVKSLSSTHNVALSSHSMRSFMLSLVCMWWTLDVKRNVIAMPVLLWVLKRHGCSSIFSSYELFLVQYNILFLLNTHWIWMVQRWAKQFSWFLFLYYKEIETRWMESKIIF